MGAHRSDGAQAERAGARLDQAAMLVIFAVLTALYWYTAPRSVVLEDDGLFVLSSWFFGIEHPPGYPLYVALGKLATLVPMGSPAWRVHALSGLLAALACVLVYRIGRLLLPNRLLALFVAIAVGVSETFWSQALVADVYSLHALILCALLYLALAERLDATPSTARTQTRLVTSALVAGLGISNHWPLLLLSAPGLLLLWLPTHRDLIRRLPALTGVFLLGLLPYAVMVWRSQQQPEISFLGPIDSRQEFIDYFLRKHYAHIDSSPDAGPADKLQYAAFLVRLAGSQLLLPGALLALIGAFGQWQQWRRTIAAGLTLVFLGPTLLLVLLLNFEYGPQWRDVYRVYPLPAWIILALWAGLGLHLAVKRSKTRRPRLFVGSLATLLIGAALLWHWHRNDRHDDWLAHTYAETLLASASPESVFLASGETVIPTTGYLHLVEGMRPDILLIAASGLVIEPRWFDPRSLPSDAGRIIVDAKARLSGRPIYRMHNHDGRAGTWNWLGFQINPASARDGPDIKLVLGERERRLLRRLARHGPFAQGWNEVLRRSLLEDFVVFMTWAEVLDQPLAQETQLRNLSHSILKQPETALRRAELLARTDPAGRSGEIRGLLEYVAGHIDDPWLTEEHLRRFLALAAAGNHNATDADRSPQRTNR